MPKSPMDSLCLLLPLTQLSEYSVFLDPLVERLHGLTWQLSALFQCLHESLKSVGFPH